MKFDLGLQERVDILKPMSILFFKTCTLMLFCDQNRFYMHNCFKVCATLDFQIATKPWEMTSAALKHSKGHKDHSKSTIWIHCWDKNRIYIQYRYIHDCYQRLPLSATLYDIYYLYLLHYTIFTTFICYTIRYLLPLSATLYDSYYLYLLHYTIVTGV